MSNNEITKDIVIALINNSFLKVENRNYAQSVAETYETIFKKVSELNDNK